MAEFTNEFTVKSIPDVLRIYDVSFDKRFQVQRNFDFKCAAQASRKLSDEMQVAVASIGARVVTALDVALPPIVSVTMKIDGLPTDVDVTIKPMGEIKTGDRGFAEAVRKHLNRRVDVVLKANNYQQDGRSFYEQRSKEMGRFYAVHEGIHVSSRFNDSTFTIIIDPVTQVRAKLNLLEMLNEELQKQGKEHWKDAAELPEEINKVFRGKAYNLRSSYVEPHRDEPRHNVYKFAGLRFDKSVSSSNDPRSPIHFHKSFGREISPDQPIVEVIAQDGRKVDHVPQLLEELPTPRTLKRFGASGRIHDRALKDANTRFYMTSELLKPLVTAEIINSAPIQVGVEEFSPVRITFEGGYIDIESNMDFQEIFKKKGLQKKPQIGSIIVFSTEKDAAEAIQLTKELLKTFVEFKLHQPKIVEKLDLPDSLEGFYERVSKELEPIKPTKSDLVLIVFGFEDEDIEELTYTNLKRDSLQSLFPSQFVSTESIKEAVEEDNLRKGLANPLFLQIVAKCGGQPHGLQPGFVAPGTIFVGLDTYRQAFKTNPSTVVSVTIFDSEGSYICGNSDTVPFGQFPEATLSRLVNESYEAYKTIKKADASMIVYMIDTGFGTIDQELGNYVKACAETARSASADYVFITGNKGSHLRLYKGDAADFAFTAERVSPFTAATKMTRENEILVVSTEPVISRRMAKEFGTPRAVLYTVMARGSQQPIEDVKTFVAKSITWLCRHAWISPASTREPAPIFFANKLSKVVAATGIRVSPDTTTAPLFL